MMTHGERLLAVIEGRAPYQIPWVPRLLLWHTAQQKQGKLPDRFHGMSLRQIERDLGLGTPARNGQIFKTQLSGVEIKTQQKGVEHLDGIHNAGRHGFNPVPSFRGTGAGRIAFSTN